MTQRGRALLGAVLGTAMVGGGIVLSQVAQADTSTLPAPAASGQSSAPAPSVSASQAPSVVATPSMTPSASPSAGDHCRRTDAQIVTDHPSATVKVEYGARNYYEGGQIIASTQDGIGWEAPCWIR